MNKYVQERKSGERKSAVGNNSDLLSLFFSDPEVFTDDVIVDELFDFFAAATITTENTSQTMLSHYIKDRDSLLRVRSEFDAIKDSRKKDDGEDLGAVLLNLVTLDTVQDLEYQNRVVQESLRFQTPAKYTSAIEALDDFKAGSLNIKIGTVLKINMDGLHHNSKEWQRHEEFLPERFNPDSDLFLTPDGKKRNPYSWLPFNGG